MNRLLVAVLAAVDAAVAAVIGIGVVLVPLTLLWLTAFSGAEWSALWSTAIRIWELGNLVPLHLSLDDAFLVQSGVSADAQSFVVSLAPLALAGFVLLFAARSGRRAARAGAWGIGVASGTVVTTVIAALALVTSASAVVDVQAWQAVLLPVALYAGGALVGAVATAWGEGDEGPIDALHDRVDALPPAWRALPGLAVRGTGIVLAGLLGFAGLALVAAVIAGGGEMVTLFQMAQTDAIGAAGLTLAHLAYLPTLLVWALAWIAGPGVAVGTSTIVSPAVVDLGVVPSMPVMGLIPEQGSPFLLLVLLAPVTVGALAGLSLRLLLIQEWRAEGILDDDREPVLPRLALAGGVAVLSAAMAALLSLMASGSMGPGRLIDVGPEAGPVALAVGLEVLLGAVILLLGPRSRRRGWVEFDD